MDRHIGPDSAETEKMLETCNVRSLEQLIKEAIPANILDPQALTRGTIGQPIPEAEFLARFRTEMEVNQHEFKSLIGCGFHPNILPGVIQRNMLENPGWYTAYTPYQAEIAQGRLESLLNYQTIVQELTGLAHSNSSLLDEASAGGEAFYMAYNIHGGSRHKFFVDQGVFPTTIEVIKTKARYLEAEVIVDSYQSFLTAKYKPAEFCGILLQTPNN